MSSGALKELHTAIVDARKGYSTAIKDADDQSLKSIFQETDQLHASAELELHKMLVAQGEKADDSGSFMGTVHTTVISIRSALSGLDHGSLDTFADGEQNIVDKYDEAIRDEADYAVRQELEAQRTALIRQILKMREMA